MGTHGRRPVVRNAACAACIDHVSVVRKTGTAPTGPVNLTIPARPHLAVSLHARGTVGARVCVSRPLVTQWAGSAFLCDNPARTHLNHSSTCASLFTLDPKR